MEPSGVREWHRNCSIVDSLIASGILRKATSSFDYELILKPFRDFVVYIDAVSERAKENKKKKKTG